MDREADYLGRYRSISNKLKKRFLKKPNVAEGSEQFGLLAKAFQHEECPQYAAFCCLAQARCEHTLANAAGEAQSLTVAARSFITAEFSNQDLGCASFEEHLGAAISCYGHAIRVHTENKQTALAATLCIELGNTLKRLKRPDQAVGYFQKAAQLQYQSPLACLSAMKEVSSCKLDTKDYEGALSVLTEMTFIAQDKGTVNGKALGAYSEVLATCEVSRVLLLMLLQPSPQKMRPEHAETLEKYAWQSTEDNTPDFLTDDLFLLLQSLVLACHSKDIDSLRKLQVDLWSLLTAEQNQLIHLIIQDFSR